MKRQQEADQQPQAITGRDIGAVVAFLPVLKSIPPGQLAVWPKNPETGEVLIPVEGPIYHQQVCALMDAFNEHGFVQPFDWHAWSGAAKKYVAQPQFLRRAKLKTCIKLITTHVRADRFCGGHFGEMVRCGQITAILRRLAEIRDTMK